MTENPARGYALGIAREVAALDAILSHPTDPETVADALAELEAEHLTDENTPDEIAVAAFHYWVNSLVLDVRVLRDIRTEDSARIEFLRTTGGPRCEIVRDTTNGTVVTVEVWDGASHHAHQMNPDTFAAWVDDLALGGLS